MHEAPSSTQQLGTRATVLGSTSRERHGCEFGEMFKHEDGDTPEELLKNGIYSEIACSMKGGLIRAWSLAMLAAAFAKPFVAPEPVTR